MGQAKLRGTRAERVAAAIQRQEARLAQAKQPEVTQHEIGGKRIVATGSARVNRLLLGAAIAGVMSSAMAKGER